MDGNPWNIYQTKEQKEPDFRLTRRKKKEDGYGAKTAVVGIHLSAGT